MQRNNFGSEIIIQYFIKRQYADICTKTIAYSEYSSSATSHDTAKVTVIAQKLIEAYSTDMLLPSVCHTLYYTRHVNARKYVLMQTKIQDCYKFELI